MLPEFRNNIRTSPFEGSQTSPVCSVKFNMEMKMNVEYWRNETDRGKQKYPGKGLST